MAVANEVLFPNRKEAPEFNIKLPVPETTCPAKLMMPFTDSVFPVLITMLAPKETSFPEETVILLAPVGGVVAAT